MDNAKFWTLYYAELVLAQSVKTVAETPRIKIVTKMGIIEANVCPSPDETAEDNEKAKKIVSVRNQVLRQTCPIDNKDYSLGMQPIFPFDDSTPLLLRNVIINKNDKLPYMLIFPSEIIGISL